MAARMTIERIRRDADDASGQSIRDWKAQTAAEPDFLARVIRERDAAREALQNIMRLTGRHDLPDAWKIASDALKRRS